MNGRTVAGLGCIMAFAVMVGIVGAVVLLGTIGSFGAALALAPHGQAASPGGSASAPATPTIGYVESMKPIPVRVDVPNAAGAAMTADQDGGESFFLANGTRLHILQVDGHLGRVQVMSGPYVNRVGWLQVNATSQ